MNYKVIKGSRNPLSCDVAYFEGDKYVWLIEAGASDEIIEEINKLNKDIAIVISHFHPDHMANLKRINYKKLYLGENTFKYVGDGQIIDKDIIIDDGIKIHLFPLSSCHAKGSIALEIDDYCFIGDGLSPTNKKNHYVYNVQQLNEEIKQFKSLKANYLVESHKMDKPINKKEIIQELSLVFNKREKGNPYIIVE